MVYTSTCNDAPFPPTAAHLLVVFVACATSIKSYDRVCEKSNQRFGTEGYIAPFNPIRTRVVMCGPEHGSMAARYADQQ